MNDNIITQLGYNIEKHKRLLPLGKEQRGCL